MSASKRKSDRLFPPKAIESGDRLEMAFLDFHSNKKLASPNDIQNGPQETFLQGSSGLQRYRRCCRQLQCDHAALQHRSCRLPAGLGDKGTERAVDRQINLNFLQIGGGLPVLKLSQDAQSWSYIDNSGPADPSTLDSNGYPIFRFSRAGGLHLCLMFPSQIERPWKIM